MLILLPLTTGRIRKNLDSLIFRGDETMHCGKHSKFPLHWALSLNRLASPGDQKIKLINFKLYMDGRVFNLLFKPPQILKIEHHVRFVILTMFRWLLGCKPTREFLSWWLKLINNWNMTTWNIDHWCLINVRINKVLGHRKCESCLHPILKHLKFSKENSSFLFFLAFLF